MLETTMPAAEATSTAHDHEPVSYELAYHVLPTVAEGEVASVTDVLKKYITDEKGEVFDEEAAGRFELAYEIEKYLEGRHRRFTSAYFGWVRFRLDPASLETIEEELRGNKQLLRHMVVRLTKTEEESPFKFHEALAASNPRVINVGEEEVTTEETESETVEEGTPEEAAEEKTDEATS